MKNFRVGDLAIINKDAPEGAGLRKGDIVTITAVYPADAIWIFKNTFKVEDFMGERWRVKEEDLDTYVELPIGTQIQLNLLDGSKCDCGGFKTYGSMEPSYHSATLPCSSLKK